jgi:hypothetical protein
MLTIRTIALAAVLFARPAAAQETKSEPRPSQWQSGDQAKGDRPPAGEKPEGA